MLIIDEKPMKENFPMYFPDRYYTMQLMENVNILWLTSSLTRKSATTVARTDP
jgi:hypothetical protein